MNPDLAMQRALDRAGRVGFDALSERDQTLVCVWNFESKVANGGLEHFYRSKAADIASHVPAALLRLGATTRAEIATQANAIFGAEGVPADRSRRKEVLSALPKETLLGFDELERRFYDGTSELDAKLEQYLTQTQPTAEPK